MRYLAIPSAGPYAGLPASTVQSRRKTVAFPDLALAHTTLSVQGCTKITFECFERALALIAAAKGTTREALEAAITSSGGPLLTPSKN